jgi:hypothetical protein
MLPKCNANATIKKSALFFFSIKSESAQKLYRHVERRVQSVGVFVLYKTGTSRQAIYACSVGKKKRPIGSYFITSLNSNKCQNVFDI